MSQSILGAQPPEEDTGFQFWKAAWTAFVVAFGLFLGLIAAFITALFTGWINFAC